MTTTIMQSNDTDVPLDADEPNNTQTWKQEAVAMNPQMNKLLQPEFDQATFLYNMYKSCTVEEIEDFKICLNQIRESTI